MFVTGSERRRGGLGRDPTRGVASLQAPLQISRPRLQSNRTVVLLLERVVLERRRVGTRRRRRREALDNEPIFSYVSAALPAPSDGGDALYPGCPRLDVV